MTTLDITPDTAVERQGRLAEKVSALRGRRGLGDRWLLLIGGTLIPLGIILVLLGWRGASRTPLLFEQTSYLISGGLLGLALVFAGGFMYFAYWLTLLVRENRTGRTELIGVLTRVEQLLAEGGAVQGRRSAPAAAFVATRNGTMFHRADCAAVDGKDALRQVTADAAGLSACKLCDPR